eukprot:6309015-Pyramimonas_sp.AAC.1
MGPTRPKKAKGRPKRPPTGLRREAREAKIVSFRWEDTHFLHVRIFGLHCVENCSRGRQDRPRRAQ